MVLRTEAASRPQYDSVQREFCMPYVYVTMFMGEQPRRRWRMKPTHTSLIAWHVLAFAYYWWTGAGCSATQSVQLRDLSHTFDENTIYWVTAKKLNLTVLHNGTVPGRDYWLQTDEMAAGTHGGTHLDAPCHFALGSWCVSDIPIERLVVPASVIDISRHVGDDPNVHLTLNHVLEWEKTHGPIPDGNLLLIRTGWSRFWPDPLAYSGTTERRQDMLKFPSIQPEVARWLVENRAIVGVGIDTMSVDIPSGDRGTHVTLMERNIYGLENVNMREPLPPSGVKAYVMPMKLKGASGAPCRILAEVPPEKDAMTSAGHTIGSSNYHHSSIWTLFVAVLWIIKTFRFQL